MSALVARAKRHNDPFGPSAVQAIFAPIAKKWIAPHPSGLSYSYSQQFEYLNQLREHVILVSCHQTA